MEKHPLIRTVYLYLFTIIGLVLVVIGTVRFLDLGLKVFIFKQADAQQKYQQQYCNYIAPVPEAKVRSLINQPASSTGLTPDEQTALKSFLDNYDQCQGVNFLTSQRQRDASINLALILVGLPLYLYHWRTIAKEIRKKEDEKV
jgi:hypothetical protein